MVPPCKVRHTREGAGNVGYGRTRTPLRHRKSGERKRPTYGCACLCSTRPLGGLLSYLDPGEVKEVAATIKDIDRAELRRRYDAIDTESYGELSDSDFEYTWSWFRHLRDFFQKAAAANRHMLFTVDQ